MKKTQKKVPEETKPGDDLEAFEEWEEGAASEEEIDQDLETTASGLPKGEVELEEELDLGDLEIPEEPEGEPAAARKEPEPAAEPVDLADQFAELAPDVPINLVAVIGKSTTNVGDLIAYRIGHVIDLGRAPGETVDLVANGRLIARGELVEMDGKLGVRILKMVR